MALTHGSPCPEHNLFLAKIDTQQSELSCCPSAHLVSQEEILLYERPQIENHTKSSQVKIYSPNDTQAKYTEQSATNAPLRSARTQGAPCRKQQAVRE